jgi:hypothetical protein
MQYSELALIIISMTIEGVKLAFIFKGIFK